MNKKWELFSVENEAVENLKSKYHISELLATCLVNRGIVSDDEIRMFLEPTRSDFHNPFLMPDMEPAVKRILKAMDNQERVIIYGDYDVDGITSTMVLKKFFSEHGLEVGYKIPNRLNEGYGLNKEAVKKIADDVEQQILNQFVKEVPSTKVAELTMKKLKHYGNEMNTFYINGSEILPSNF